MELKTVAVWVVGIGATIITAYIFWNAFLAMTNPPMVDWATVTEVGAPLPVTPLTALTILDIGLIGILITYLNAGLKGEKVS